MLKDQKATIQITRKGVFIWAALFFFIAAWMFVLGILVGRGTAPVTLDMDRLEKELFELKSALLKKENAQFENSADRQAAPPIELGFYEALKQTKPDREFKVNPNPPAQKAPTVKIETKPAAPQQPETGTGQPHRPSAPKTETTARMPAPAAQAPDVIQGGYTIQAAAFKNAANAERLVQSLRDNGFPAYQTQTQSDGSGLFRVRVGAFVDRGAAETMLGRLQSQAIKGVIVATP